jgi:hypothetical protein
MATKIFKLTVLTFSLILLLALSAFAQQEKAKKKKEPPTGTPVLWREPTDIESRDLFLGPGGVEMQPDISRITFLEDRPGGYSIKYLVSDGAGRKWVTKRREEAKPETAATRLVWAVGYFTDITYFVPRVTIIGKGTFDDVRFEARPKGVKRLDPWEWEKNPFVGTRELQGLKIMMALINNWDCKNSNNEILFIHNEATDQDELRYIISDLGATFGKTGGPFSHTRNRPRDYVKTKFITGVKNNLVQFDYHGKNSSMFSNITVADAKWIGGLLARLSDQQIRDAFRAAGYSSADIELLASTVRTRINELVNL